MTAFDRIHDLHRLLHGRRTAIPLKDILEQMECSRATFNRIKRHMTDCLGAPIEYDRSRGGYFYNEKSTDNYELPGIWFNQQELHALLMIQSLTKDFGVLSDILQPIEKRFRELLHQSAIDPEKIASKVSFLGVATRKVDHNIFMPVMEATLDNTRISIRYKKRDIGEESEREISPQKVINYRNNWYLDAWCHLRSGLRTFAIECICSVKSSEQAFKTIPDSTLDEYYQKSYGFIAGGEVDYATIHFSPAISHRVADEQWHPKQEGHFLENGDYELRLPFNRDNPNELIMHVIQHDIRAKIIEPAYLRTKLQTVLRKTLAMYDEDD